ncbi:MAG: hypothetical protein KKG96_06250 [Proteobacteria bacterium]|nr:hypothetical protein [Pseudomonadota bacterium]MBU1965641.1 hypothetical protein [Pseudomonadota bacterium]
MIRLRLFGRCRIYHDPVSPVLKAPAQIGWASWFRDIDLVTPRKLKGKELLLRTRGWWTIEPSLVAGVVEKHGKLVVGEKGELMIEFESETQVSALSLDLIEHFKDQVLLAP